MDSSSDTGQLSSEPALTAYRQGATGDIAVTTPQFAFPSNPDTWTSTLDSQSRDNLRQASVALDTAYERITSLRNSISDMLNRIPRESAGAATSANTTDSGAAQSRSSLSHDTSIRPPHSALVLTSEQVVEELNLRAARLRTLVSPSARQRLEEFESSNGNNTRRESVWDRFSQSDRPRLEPLPVLPRPRTPPMPDPVSPRVADSADSRATQRRDLQSASRDESSTMIGRRVAARLNTSESLSSRLTLSEIEQRLQAQTAQIARELENMTDRLAAQRSRRVELASSSLRGDTPAIAVRDARRTSSQAASASIGSDLRSPNPPAGRRPLGPARDVTLVDNTAHIVLPQPISRTSSNGMPIDEYLPPPGRTLSTAYREHIATYRDHANAYPDNPRNLANTPEVRGTLVNLLARDRDDQFQPARQSERVRSGVGNNRRGDASTRSNPSPPTGQGRRRRGWARLNADGDEIDSDEDDNVSPHTRLRFAYGTNVDRPARSHTVTIEDILWRTSGSDSEVDALSPDSTESCPSLFQGSPPRPAVRRPYPLPTPAEDMLAHPTVKPLQRPRVVCVSKYASLAGR